MDEHMLFHNRHFRIMQNTPVEPAAQRLALPAAGENQAGKRETAIVQKQA
jgi:hypothetical protein